MTGELPAATPERQRPGPLHIYSYYRVILGAALLLLYVLNPERGERVLRSDVDLFLAEAVGYFTLALFTSLLGNAFISRESWRALLFIAIDILSLALLAHASGGVSSTITPLLVVTVAAGGILLSARQGYVVAASATLAMLYEQFHYALSNGLPLMTGSTQVGLLGIAFFGVVVATNQLSRRLQQSEALARARQREITELEHLNAHIIQRMRTGILVVDERGSIRLTNSAAEQMLVPDGWQGGRDLDALSQELLRRIRAWREDNNLRFPPFRNHALGPEMNTSMTAVSLGERQATLVFLEDMAAMAQHLQQMKLASLGRLTASIAHEIRNPLAAISHAAQLLPESATLSKEDARLAEIIQQQSLRLDRIVENVLQLSRRQLPRTDLLELAGWLRQFRTDYLATHPPGDDVEVVVPPAPLRARFDPHHLQQILQNLCDNGLRFGRAHAGAGKVRLEILLANDGDTPLLRIHDNGPGIGAGQVANLFEPFYTTDARGTGLGLYIARELCEANRARLAYIPHAENRPGYFQITFAHPGRIAS